ncbi:MAG: hypothetical protein OEX00_10705, partial [Gammaproteobacteria bacterium]|nr:hypothetical protein [Gammaproteobacteria bacterium]
MEHSLKVNTIRKLAITASQELGLTLLLLFGVSIVVFSILYAAPGDAFSLLLGADQASQVKSAMGVSDGWLGQYTGWLFNIIRGDFGNS